MNGKPLDIVDSYCYLGILLHQSGDIKLAQQSLKTKAMRAFFGLKRVVLRSKLSFKALSTLFDSLIKPIILYGAPIWAPCCSVNKSSIRSINSPNMAYLNFIRKISNSLQEKVHLSFLKWALGVHRKASNIGVWGESGRFPLIFEAIKLSLNYFKRLESLHQKSFVSAALREQKALNLPWFKNVKSLAKLDEIYSLDHVSAFRVIHSKPETKPKPHNGDCLSTYFTHAPKLKPVESKKFRVGKVMETLKKHFTQCWELSKSSSPKLEFYHSIKGNFNKEPYLDFCKGFSRRYSTTKLRISAHQLQIEQGRVSNVPARGVKQVWA